MRPSPALSPRSGRHGRAGPAWLCLTLMLGLGPVTASGNCRLSYAGEVVNGKCEDVSPASALAELGRLSGVTVRGTASGERFSRSFRDTSLEAAFRMLLRGQSHILRYRENGSGRQLAEVHLLPPGEDALLPLPVSRPPARQESEQAASTEPPRGSVRIPLLKDGGRGRYQTRVRLNGMPVEALIDTGATTVVIPRDLAARLQLPVGPTVTVQTANGPSAGYATQVRQVDLAGLRRQRVEAVVLPALEDVVLLGMSFLEGFSIETRDGVMTLREDSLR